MGHLINLFVTSLTITGFLNKEVFVFSGWHTETNNRDDFSGLESALAQNVSGPVRRIIGGRFVKKIHRFPFMAYLYREKVTYVVEETGNYKTINVGACGSTILNPNFVLTAAHCVKTCDCGETHDDEYCSKCTSYKPEDFTVYAGNVVSGKAETKITIKHIHIHPKYKITDVKHNCAYRFDLAILELTEPFKFSGSIKSVKIPDIPAKINNNSNTMTTTLSKTDKKCIILGWGITYLEDSTKFLQEKLKLAKIPLIDTQECLSHIYKVRRMDKHPGRKNMCPDVAICTKGRKDDKGICYGDSGGPIICDGVQVGVSSWGLKSCVGPNRPHVYARVDVSLHWIRKIAFKS